MTTTMLAGRLDLVTRDFAIEEVPIPEPGPGEVLVEVRASGVCLSDVHLIDGTLRPVIRNNPITLGHEVAGVVHTLGSEIPPGITVGQRVLLQALQTCGACENCGVRRFPCQQPMTRGVHFDGGWAEYAIARVDTVVPIPDDLPFDQAAIIPDAVSTPYAAITTTAQVRPAQSVGAWGVGGLGAHGVQLLRMIGAAPIIAFDPLTAARERALAFGADVALDPTAPNFLDEVRRMTNGRGLDHTFDFAGVPAVRQQAQAALAAYGSLTLVGLTREPLTITDSAVPFSTRHQRLLGHYGSLPQHVDELVTLVEHHRLDLTKSISGHIPLAKAADAMQQLADKVNDPIRLILTP
ncbi:zinc-binding dehydrogenase [Actinocrispum wychmicini]|uniref:D-arabinose 1-dehydrogenase-like Zn-dependent alcohol dehydrogenase n=1 Tax=Actinocrispum wychmicini TaxID=1213861 RepID=A0A4R2JZW1_9PSEU|nr:zinc-binding dehydrogenase [Actinocrispum wychmicini]TCO62859.1 D-arabinose 1-dehydrogenase-like Zn-dependent alcohol dehydrogenase [Actinocrispum wychmicini]